MKLYVDNDEARHQAIAIQPGSGACGGIVGAFRALFPAQTKVVSGMDFIADLCDLEQKIKESDLVITGEGSYDEQTLQGKAV